MALPELSNEGLGEHALEFDGIEGSRIFSGAFEWMDGSVKGRLVNMEVAGIYLSVCKGVLLTGRDCEVP